MTIYALSTGPGISGIAIIRVSGEDTKKVIQVINQWSSSGAKGCNIEEKSIKSILLSLLMKG